MQKDDLGDRMKLYEGAESLRRALPRLPVVIRVDGKCFSTWTRGLPPFDVRMEYLRQRTTAALIQMLGACVGYHQSDEITLVLAPQADGAVYAGGRFQKLVSHAVSTATAVWNAALKDLLPEKAAGRPALFDARAWVVPNQEEAVNAILWREWDATKNSIAMAAQSRFSHKQLHGKDQRAMLDMLHEVGVDWATHYPAWAKRGTYMGRRTLQRKLTAAERLNLPPLHNAHKNPEMLVERSEIRVLDMPPFAGVVNRVAVVFDGAEPLYNRRSGTCEQGATMYSIETADGTEIASGFESIEAARAAAADIEVRTGKPTFVTTEEPTREVDADGEQIMGSRRV